VTVDGPAVVLVPVAKVGYAAGRVPSALVRELRERRRDWTVCEVTGPAEARDALHAGHRPIVVVEGQHDPAHLETVAAVLDADPDAVVVYGGLAREDDRGTHTVHSFGTGAATAAAVADLVTRGAR
jgi:hypothetical protein